MMMMMNDGVNNVANSVDAVEDDDAGDGDGDDADNDNEIFWTKQLKKMTSNHLDNWHLTYFPFLDDCMRPFD